MFYFSLEVSQNCIFDFLINIIHLHQLQIPVSPHRDIGFFINTAPWTFNSPKNTKRNISIWLMFNLQHHSVQLQQWIFLLHLTNKSYIFSQYI